MEGGISLQGLQSKIVAATARINEWCGLATELEVKLEIVQVEVALQFALWKFAWERRILKR